MTPFISPTQYAESVLRVGKKENKKNPEEGQPLKELNFVSYKTIHILIIHILDNKKITRNNEHHI